MAVGKLDIWDNADALAMAVRLHVARRASAEIEDMLGLAVIDIVDLATRLLLKSKPNYIPFRSTMFSKDTQGELVMLVFRAIASGHVATSNPRAMVNFFIKVAQNRLRNLRRNGEVRRLKADIRTESELGITTADALSTRVADFTGKEVLNKVTTRKREVSSWDTK